MERIVKFERGYDCIKFECANNSPSCQPGSGGSHGQHGLNIRFIVKGSRGAVQFLLYTGWLPQHVKRGPVGLHIVDWGGKFMMAADLGFHSLTPRYEDHASMGPCEVLDGKDCYYDGSGLNANDAMYALVNGGDDALWSFLEEYYKHEFEGGEYPVPAEYPMPQRGEMNDVQ